jgi:hypothetical protein
MPFETVLGRRHEKTRAAPRALRFLWCLALGCAPGIAVLQLGCGPSPRVRDDGATAAAAAPVINGADDRKELYELLPDAARQTIAASVAVLMWAHRIDYSDIAAPRALTLEESTGVCADERFADQPAAALCSATLIDDDLVLTAGHCLGESLAEANDHCSRLLVVFDFFMRAPGDPFPLSGAGVYACRRVAHHVVTSAGEDFRDIAVIELDRGVDASRRPASLAGDPPGVGDSVLEASSGAGVPLKIDAGGAVVDVPDGTGFLVASTDSFAGGSGAPLFNEALEFVGHQVRGLADWRSDGGCLRAAVAEQANEQHQRVAVTLAALCESGWPSVRLCLRGPRCGDGICTASESNEICAADCPPPDCGDFFCDLDERDECPEDCARYRSVPASWYYDPADFAPATGEPPVRERDPGCSLRRPPAQRMSWFLVALLLFAGAGRRRHAPTGCSPTYKPSRCSCRRCTSSRRESPYPSRPCHPSAASSARRGSPD